MSIMQRKSFRNRNSSLAKLNYLLYVGLIRSNIFLKYFFTKKRIVLVAFLVIILIKIISFFLTKKIIDL